MATRTIPREYTHLLGREPIGADQAYKERHAASLGQYGIRTNTEQAYALMLRGWLMFADAHRDEYGSEIGEDGYTGDEAWLPIAKGLRAMLSCDLGRRMDCGTVDGIILDALTKAGYSESAL